MSSRHVVEVHYPLVHETEGAIKILVEDDPERFTWLPKAVCKGLEPTGKTVRHLGDRGPQVFPVLAISLSEGYALDKGLI